MIDTSFYFPLALFTLYAMGGFLLLAGWLLPRRLVSALALVALLVAISLLVPVYNAVNLLGLTDTGLVSSTALGNRLLILTTAWRVDGLSLIFAFTSCLAAAALLFQDMLRSFQKERSLTDQELLAQSVLPPVETTIPAQSSLSLEKEKVSLLPATSLLPDEQPALRDLNAVPQNDGFDLLRPQSSPPQQEGTPESTKVVKKPGRYSRFHNFVSNSFPQRFFPVATLWSLALFLTLLGTTNLLLVYLCWEMILLLLFLVDWHASTVERSTFSLGTGWLYHHLPGYMLIYVAITVLGEHSRFMDYSGIATVTHITPFIVTLLALVALIRSGLYPFHGHITTLRTIRSPQVGLRLLVAGLPAALYFALRSYTLYPWPPNLNLLIFFLSTIACIVIGLVALTRPLPYDRYMYVVASAVAVFFLTMATIGQGGSLSLIAAFYAVPAFILSLTIILLLISLRENDTLDEANLPSGGEELDATTLPVKERGRAIPSLLWIGSILSLLGLPLTPGFVTLWLVQHSLLKGHLIFPALAWLLALLFVGTALLGLTSYIVAPATVRLPHKMYLVPAFLLLISFFLGIFPQILFTPFFTHAIFSFQPGVDQVLPLKAFPWQGLYFINASGQAQAEAWPATLIGLVVLVPLLTFFAGWLILKWQPWHRPVIARSDRQPLKRRDISLLTHIASSSLTPVTTVLTNPDARFRALEDSWFFAIARALDEPLYRPRRGAAKTAKTIPLWRRLRIKRSHPATPQSRFYLRKWRRSSQGKGADNIVPSPEEVIASTPFNPDIIAAITPEVIEPTLKETESGKEIER